jgi:hypothetical protein
VPASSSATMADIRFVYCEGDPGRRAAARPQRRSSSPATRAGGSALGAKVAKLEGLAYIYRWPRPERSLGVHLHPGMRRNRYLFVAFFLIGATFSTGSLVVAGGAAIAAVADPSVVGGVSATVAVLTLLGHTISAPLVHHTGIKVCATKGYVCLALFK